MGVIKPYKLVGQLVAQNLDDEGEVVGETIVGDLVLFANQFDQLSTKIEEAWPEIELRFGSDEKRDKAPA